MREIEPCLSGSWPGFTGASTHGGCRACGPTLTLLGARYYDEVVGQFISVDPLLDASVPGHFLRLVGHVPDGEELRPVVVSAQLVEACNCHTVVADL